MSNRIQLTLYLDRQPFDLLESTSVVILSAKKFGNAVAATFAPSSLPQILDYTFALSAARSAAILTRHRRPLTANFWQPGRDDSCAMGLRYAILAGICLDAANILHPSNNTR